MKATLPPYPSYKPSAIPWLQQVPEHWEVLPNRALFTEVKEAGRPEDEMLSVTIGRGVLKQAEHLATTTKKDSARKDKSTYKRVAKGDIVYNKMRAWQGAFGMSRFNGIVSPAYVVSRPTQKASSEYYHYLFRTPLFAKEAERNSYGLASDIWNLRPEHFKTILNVAPSKEEQHLIVRYLHALDAKVKRYIRAKRSLIARLQEQKQAIIQRAVTRGLDPNVKLKPSGVEWLGEVPEHWEVRRLASVASFQSGKAHENFIEPNGQYVCVNARFVSSEGASRKYCTQSFCTAVKGDVLMVMSDLPNGRALARAYLVEDDSLYAVNQRVCRLRAFAMNPKFLTYAANRNPGLMRHNDGFNQTHLSNSDYKTLPLIVPPRHEQDEIVRLVEPQLAHIEVSVRAIEREVRILNEYHTRLIADVVTGAVDVREAAQALPGDQVISGSDDQIMEEEAVEPELNEQAE